jgi:hypothetical protein
MSLLSILLKLVAVEFAGSWWPAAAAAVALSLWADMATFRDKGPASRWHRLARTAGRVLLANAACLVFVWLADQLASFLGVRVKEGIPAVAALLHVTLQALHLPFSTLDGALSLSTMAGNLNWLVSYDSLGARPVLRLLALALAYLLSLKRTGKEVCRALAFYVPAVLLAAFLRAVSAIGVFVFACYFLDAESEEFPIRPFLESPVITLSLIACFLLFVPLAKRFGVLGQGTDRQADGQQGSPAAPHRPFRRRLRDARRPLAAVAAFGVLLGYVFWEPRGTTKQGTVLISTFHTKWSPTDRDYDKTWFGPASGYNYNSLKKFLEVYFDVRELPTRITEQALKDASVLFIYDPDSAFSAEEQEAVQRFVKRGGGLLLVGDHTNVFGSTANLNTVAAPFGLRYRDDVLFDMKENFFQIIYPTLFSPALLKGIEIFRFRGPTSVIPTAPFTKVLMSIPHSKSLRAIYSVNNFYPRPANHPGMKVGEFAVAVSAHAGQGRVLAFCDSTLFSQFEIFFPGKWEFMLNGINWLNHRDPAAYGSVRWLALAASALVLLGLLLTSAGPGALLCRSLLCVGAGCLAWLTANGLARQSLSLPPQRIPATFLFFAADENDARVGLRKFVAEGKYSEKYEIFVQWVLRNGMFPAFVLLGENHSRALYHHVAASPAATMGVALIIRDREQLRRQKNLDPDLLSRTRRFLFLLGSEMKAEDAGEIMAALGCTDVGALERAAPLPGVSDARVVRWEGRTYVFVFSAERFSDERMGISEKVQPSQAQKDLYELEYKLLDAVFAAP